MALASFLSLIDRMAYHSELPCATTTTNASHEAVGVQVNTDITFQILLLFP